ncbi:MAG: hypothetical protein LBV08_10465, partial [Clostridiales bacterium]|nr:hypothetical protein [Clostridiales bacterium]
ITSGLEKKEEYTFDDKKTISGLANTNTKISFQIFRKNDKNEFVLVENSPVIVSKPGIFNKELNLELGETKLVILAEYKRKNARAEVIIYRLDPGIKEELENYLLPEQKIKGLRLAP